MWIFQNLFQRKKTEKNEVKSFNSNDLLNPYWPSDNFYSIFNLKSLTRTDYLRLYTGWAYSCVNAISDTASSVDFHIVTNKWSDKLVNNKVIDLITPELIKTISSYLQLSGTCYILKEQFWRKVDRLIVLRPDMMQLVDNVTPMTPYCYTDGNWQTYYYNEEEIIEIKLFNPLEHYPRKSKWVSPMGAVAMQMEMDRLAITNNKVLLKNGANPKGALSTEKSLTKQQIMELREKWNMQHNGVENAWSTVFLTDWLTFSQTAISPKELDFIESRRFTMDEVFTVFWVPKEVLGFLNNSNLASAKVAENMFRKWKIKPLLKLIENALNKQLFNWIGYFEFINIVPQDTDEARLNFQVWGLTLNEFRGKIWAKPLNEWNKVNIIDWQLSDTSYEKEEKKGLSISQEIMKKSFLLEIKWSDEWMEKKIDERNKRLESKEEQLKNAIKKVWDIQKQDLIEYIQSEKKDIKWIKDFFNTSKYYWLYLLNTIEIFTWLMLTEWQKALDDFWIAWIFNPWNSQLSKFLKTSTKLWSEAVDKASLKLFEEAIKKVEDLGGWVWQMVAEINKLYLWYEKERIETIVRTETIRAWTEWQLMAWEQSLVVTGKKWFTARDERVCSSCWPMHWKIIKLREDFYKKGDTNEWGAKMDFADIVWPPLHPRCRCWLSPITE